MQEILNDFLAETTEGLLLVEQQMLQLEKEPSNTDLVHDIFRVLHTIKGTCGFLGLTRLQKITHSSENLFGKIREGAIDLDADTLAILFESIDKIKLIVGNLSRGEPEGFDEVDEILQLRLDTCARRQKGIPKTFIEIDTAVEESFGQNSQEAIDAIFANITAVANEIKEPLIEELTPDAAAIGLTVLVDDNQKIENDDCELLACATENNIEIRREEAVALAQPDVTFDVSSLTMIQENNQSIRVNISVLDNIMKLIGELVLLRNQLLDNSKNSKDSYLRTQLTKLSFTTSELQEEVMKTRMQPIEIIWANFPRIVRDTAQQLGKKINLQMIGQDTEIDRQVLAMIKGPLMHMLYNAIDHGIEMPTARIAANKPEEGLIVLKAYHESGNIIIEIIDDGKGIDTEKVKNLVLEQQLATETELKSMQEDQVINFIFHPGFSTAQTITNFSGRGVGMDVVKVNLEKVGGIISVKSVYNMQTIFTIKIPITLTIFPALIFSCGEINFAILQSSVFELIEINKKSGKVIEYINTVPILQLRKNVLPLIMLNSFLNEPSNNFEKFVICLEVNGFKFGLVVDKIFDVQEIVVKPLAKILKRTQLFNGASVLGDGTIALVLDAANLAKSVFGNISEHNNFINQGDVDDSQVLHKKTSLLRFRSEQSYQVVPFVKVKHVADIKISELSKTEGQYVYSYNDKRIPVMVGQGMQPLNLSNENYTLEKIPLIILTDQKRQVGIIVSEVIDMIEENLHIDIPSHENGIVGACLIKNISTSIMDVNYYFKKSYPDWFMG